MRACVIIKSLLCFLSIIMPFLRKFKGIAAANPHTPAPITAKKLIKKVQKQRKRKREKKKNREIEDKIIDNNK